MDRIPIAEAEDVWLEIKGRYRTGIANGIRTASISCPDCGQVASLSNYNIDSKGRVTPSVVCPNDDCNWHTYILLEGWQGVGKDEVKDRDW